MFDTQTGGDKSNLPYPVVNSFFGITVLQVKWIHNKCLSEFEFVFDPEERTIEIHQHPFVGINIERRCVLSEIKIFTSSEMQNVFLNGDR